MGGCGFPISIVMEEFLTRFGLHRAERTDNALYMRGTDPQHHLHVTEKGDPKFIGLAYYVDSEDDLKRLAKAPGASGIETIDEPGGGKRVRLTEPNGYQIEVVCGIDQVDADPGQAAKAEFGRSAAARAGELMRLPKGPAHVKRDRPWRDDDAAVRRNGEVVSRDAGASSARTTSLPRAKTI